MSIDLGIYNTPVSEVENFEMDGDNFARARAAAMKVAEQEEANCA